jgi:hypothetical protein
MICRQCGSSNADVSGRAGFCCSCGGSLFELEAILSPASPPAGPVPPISANGESRIAGSLSDRFLPYIWGYIQGCIQIVWGIVTLLLGLVAVVVGSSGFKLRRMVFLLLISGTIYLLTGIAILRKRSYAFSLVCICMVLTMIMYYQVLFAVPSRSELLPVARTVYWILSFFYYLRRRRDLKPGW